jgi:hypothetical protein
LFPLFFCLILIDKEHLLNYLYIIYANECKNALKKIDNNHENLIFFFADFSIRHHKKNRSPQKKSVTMVTAKRLRGDQETIEIGISNALSTLLFAICAFCL